MSEQQFAGSWGQGKYIAAKMTIEEDLVHLIMLLKKMVSRVCYPAAGGYFLLQSWL